MASWATNGNRKPFSNDFLSMFVDSINSKACFLADLPSGQVVRFLVGFKNNGEQDFLVESMDASFRYPQDYSFIIQNVSYRVRTGLKST